MIILSVDYGRARTGVAVCDKNEVMASPVGVIKEYNSTVLAERISEIAKERQAQLEALLKEKADKNRAEAEALKNANSGSSGKSNGQSAEDDIKSRADQLRVLTEKFERGKRIEALKEKAKILQQKIEGLE